MNVRRSTSLSLQVLLAGFVLAGCGKKSDEKGQDHVKESAATDHAHAEAAPGGASFRPGKGIILAAETRKNLGVEVADVTEQKLPNELEFNIQIFGQKHHHALGDLDHTGCDVHGSGLVSTNAVSLVKTGQLVQVLHPQNTVLTGVVLAVTKALALGEAEIVVGVSNATTQFKAGDFATGKISIARDHPVLVVPKAAVLRTPDGLFVYTVNGGAFFRSAVKIGAEANGFVEIVDGLLSGDQVVTKPVETLWLIELRATKGGGHSH